MSEAEKDNNNASFLIPLTVNNKYYNLKLIKGGKMEERITKEELLEKVIPHVAEGKEIILRIWESFPNPRLRREIDVLIVLNDKLLAQKESIEKSEHVSKEVQNLYEEMLEKLEEVHGLLKKEVIMRGLMSEEEISKIWDTSETKNSEDGKIT